MKNAFNKIKTSPVNFRNQAKTLIALEKLLILVFIALQLMNKTEKGIKKKKNRFKGKTQKE